jgi:hypothetical protein
MSKAEALKKELDLLPASMLVEVEQLIKKLKKQCKPAKESTTLLTEVAACAIEDELPSDLAEQHDHYLYGVSKK